MLNLNVGSSSCYSNLQNQHHLQSAMPQFTNYNLHVFIVPVVGLIKGIDRRHETL